jgi:hypothetical protein
MCTPRVVTMSEKMNHSAMSDLRRKIARLEAENAQLRCMPIDLGNNAELREENERLRVENAQLRTANAERNRAMLREERSARMADNDRRRAAYLSQIEADRAAMYQHRADMLNEARQQTELLRLICGRVGDIRTEVKK